MQAWKTKSALTLERKSYLDWLKAIAPRIYTDPLAPFQQAAWDWYWELLKFRRRKKQPPDELPLNALAPWGRGLAKSTTLEMMGVAEGAILGRVFVVYISSTADKAEEHLQSMRDLIESSEIEKYYPGMAKPLLGKFGNQRSWRASRLSTDSGFSAVAAGLKEGIRGLRDNDIRPTAIFLDDLDERDDSPAVTQEKFEAVTMDALPMLAPFGLVAYGQNLIHNQSIMTQTISGEREWLLHRRVLGGGVVNTFQDDLQIEKRERRYFIMAGTPNWTRIDRTVAQDMLDKFGKDGFMREAQNFVNPTAEEMVWTGFDEKLHVITWEQFAAVFGSSKIPSRWNLYAGYDRGNTGWDRHPAVISVAAVASKDTELAGDIFIFYEYTAEAGELVDDLAKNLILDLAKLTHHPAIYEAAEMVERSYKPEITEALAWDLRRRAGGMIPFSVFNGSHEALAERNTFNLMWGLPVAKGDSDKTNGLAQLHFYLNPEAHQHPFNPSLHQRPNLYLVVAKEQRDTAKDRFGLRRLRFEAATLKWDRNVVSRDVPTKLGDDATDTVKQYLSTFALVSSPLTLEEKLERQIPARLKIENAPAAPTQGWVTSRQLAIAEARKSLENADRGEFASFWEQLD